MKRFDLMKIYRGRDSNSGLVKKTPIVTGLARKHGNLSAFDHID
jgi:hypothetical protein